MFINKQFFFKIINVIKSIEYVFTQPLSHGQGVVQGQFLKLLGIQFS